MKNLVLIFVLFMGVVSGLNAQNCTPCPPNAVCPKSCSVEACKLMCTSASASVFPASIDFNSMFSAEVKPSCLGEASANKSVTPACQSSGMAVSMPACQGVANQNSNEVKSCQPACATAAKSSCQPGAGKAASANEKVIDQQYHQVPKPVKS